VTDKQTLGRVGAAETGSISLRSTEALRASAHAGNDPARSEVFGIECEHHFGITTHPLHADGDVGQEVYRLIREAWHPTLTNDDHTFEIVENEQGWSRVVIRKNANSPLFAFKPWWCDDGDGALWFSQAYRVATRALIEAEVADRLGYAHQWQKQSDEQRDTIRGRKARAKYRSLAESVRREAELARSRWPEFEGLARTGWQERMHQHRDSDGSGEAVETAQTGSTVGESAGPQDIAHD
jgi:hypothetical protein